MRFLGLIFLSCMMFEGMGQSAGEIVQRSEEHHRGNQLHAVMEITTVRPKWSRTMVVESWSKGEELAIVIVREPKRDAGTAFLKRNSEMWNYIPRISRTIKMPPSMMSQSWMGTDFNNDDLVKESSLKTDYDKKVIGEEVVEGRKCWKLELTPKEGTAVVWGKVVLYIDQKDYLQLRTDFYDEQNTMVKQMFASDVQMIGNRLLPAKLTLVPLEKEGHKTVLYYRELNFDVGVDSEFFTTQQLKRL